MSGARELAARIGKAEVHASVEVGAEYGFKMKPVREGDQFDFGNLVLTACHTPKHMSYEAFEKL